MTNVMLTKAETARLNKILDVYCGWQIQERKVRRWVAVDRDHHHVVSETWADTLEDCQNKTVRAAVRNLSQRALGMFT
jgi:hypothetical protein